MDNVGALNVHWTARDSEVLESYAPIGAAVGQRYPEALMKSIDS
jgi:hypothetical protein